MERIGLLAGVGHLPVECTRAALAQGYEVYAVGLLDDVDPELRDCATGYADINVAKLGKIIDFLKSNGVTKVTAIGKVSKELLMSGHHALPDFRMVRLLLSLRDHKDDTLMLKFADELKKDGMELADQTLLLRGLMPPVSVLTKRTPSANERNDMQFGFRMAKELGRLDVGQTVVVKGQAVMTLEAIEGTDACIRRGGELARGELHCGGRVGQDAGEGAGDAVRREAVQEDRARGVEERGVEFPLAVVDAEHGADGPPEVEHLVERGAVEALGVDLHVPADLAGERAQALQPEAGGIGIVALKEENGVHGELLGF